MILVLESITRAFVGFSLISTVLYFVYCLVLTVAKFPGEEGYSSPVPGLRVNEPNRFLLISRQIGFALRWILLGLVILSVSYVAGSWILG